MDNTNNNQQKTYTDPITGKFTKGNPGGGRPPGSVSIVAGIKQKLLEIEPANQKTYLELFLNKLFLKAIKEGNEQLMRDIINRIDGMPKQPISGVEGEPLEFQFNNLTDEQLDQLIRSKASKTGIARTVNGEGEADSK